MATIFSKIVKGEIPCHKVYEDESTLAFLDIDPAVEGHVLVIPKKEVANFDELDDEDYVAVMNTVRLVARRLKQVMHAKKVTIFTHGFDIEHTHIHVMPSFNGHDVVDGITRKMNSPEEPNHGHLAAVASKLAF